MGVDVIAAGLAFSYDINRHKSFVFEPTLNTALTPYLSAKL